MLTTDFETLVSPVFDGSWVSLPEAERNQVVENFITVVKFVSKLRQSFDDALTTEQAKGNLTEISHIRKPRESAKTEVSMADFVKNLK